MSSTIADGAQPPGLAMAEIQRRMGLLARLMQGGALLWIALIIVQNVTFWGRPAIVTRRFAESAGLAALDPPAAAYVVLLVIIAVAIGFAGWVGLQVWRLAGIYRNGGVFTVAAAVQLRRLARAGLGALVADLIARHLPMPILTWHLADGPRLAGPWIDHKDVLFALMALFIFTLSGIFRAAAEMADEQAAII
jgi:hypothetical protein